MAWEESGACRNAVKPIHIFSMPILAIQKKSGEPFYSSTDGQ